MKTIACLATLALFACSWANPNTMRSIADNVEAQRVAAGIPPEDAGALPFDAQDLLLLLLGGAVGGGGTAFARRKKT